METRGTDGRVLERLKSAAEREDRLKLQLLGAVGLLETVCHAYFEVGDSGMTLSRVLKGGELAAWWKENGPGYKTRIAREEAERKAAALEEEMTRKRIARRALKKLTPEERRALGVSSGKRV